MVEWSTKDGNWCTTFLGLAVVVFRCGERWRLMVGPSIVPWTYARSWEARMVLGNL